MKPNPHIWDFLYRASSTFGQRVLLLVEIIECVTALSASSLNQASIAAVMVTLRGYGNQIACAHVVQERLS